MKKLYSTLFLLVFLFSGQLQAKGELPFAISATITGGTTICQGAASPLATFTGSGGTAPYTFTYTVTGGTSSTLTSTNGGNTAILNIPTNTIGSFTYEITSVTDSAGVTQALTGQTTVFTVSAATITGPASGCIGTDVQFTGTAQPATGAVSWQSSDNAVATITPGGLVHPVAPGTTSITFNGGNGCIKTQTFTIGSIINADFTFNNNACSADNVVFLSTITGGTAPYTYAWNFGDAQTSTTANPTHNFIALGCTVQTFNVVLVVTDASGCTATIQKPITIKQKPHAELQDLSANPFSNCDNNPTSGNPSYSITVHNTSTDTGCTAGYTVNWGDGSPTQTITTQLSHTYTQLGSFPLVLTATGSNGCVNTVTYNVANQSNPAGSLGTSGNTIGCAPLNVGFLIGAWELNSPGTQYVLDFGDGSSVTMQQSDFAGTTPGQAFTVPHEYTTSSCPGSGSYVASLTVTNLCNTTPYTAGSVQVRVKPIPAFTVPASGVCSQQSVTFTNTTVSGFGSNCNGAASYTWNFGDPSGANNTVTVNNVATPPNGVHIFSAPGTYTVTLSVTNTCGTEVITREICVDGVLTPSFIVDNEIICMSQTVKVVSKTSTLPGGSVPVCSIAYEWSIPATGYQATNCGVSASWAFANGTNATSPNPEFTFFASGTYTIRLRATNGCGSYFVNKNIVVKKPASVNVVNIPNQCFEPSVTINPVATISNCGTATPTYAWSFPGGTPATSTAVSPSVTYTTAGLKTFSLIVTNECGPSATITKTFTIYPELVVTSGPDITICPTVGQQLQGAASGGSGSGYVYSWSPAAGLSATNIINPVATPTATTTYTLSVKDSNNCTITDQVIVTVNQITPGTIAASQTVCAGSGVAPVPFTETVPASAPGTISYQWQNSTDNITFTDITGATGLTYTPPTVAGLVYYRRLVISTIGTMECRVPGNVVSVGINSIAAASFPSNYTICAGGSVSFTPTTAATGSGMLTYSWEQSIDNITFTAAGNPSSFSPTQTTYYRQIATSTLNSAVCSATGNVITVTVVPPPTITAEPLASQTICKDAATTPLTVTVTGGPVSAAGYTYKWFSNTTNSTTGGVEVASTITTDVTNSFTPPGIIIGTLYYYCVVSTGQVSCSDTSNVTRVIVNPAPTFTSQPLSQQLCQGQTPTALAVTYTNGTGTPDYKWFKSITNDIAGGVQIVGANAASYQPVPLSSDPDTVYYYAQIEFNGGGCSLITSNIAAVTVSTPPFVMPQAISICSNDTAFAGFRPLNAGGNTVPSNTQYVWFIVGTAPVGLQNYTSQGVFQDSFKPQPALINTTASPITVKYQVTPRSGACPGAQYELTVTINPVATIANTTSILCNNTQYNSIPTGTIPTGTTYTWIFADNTNVTGEVAETTGASTFSSGILINATATPQVIVYTVTPLSPQGNCAGTPFTISVTVNPSVSATAVTSNFNGYQLSAAGASDGSIDVTPAGGSGTYQYSWTYPDGTTHAATQDLSNLSQEGDYVLVITDASGICPPFTITVTITAPLPLEISIANTTNLICFGAANGVIEVTIDTPSIAPFDYVIKKINTDGSFTTVETVTNSNNLSYIFDNLTAGNYRVEVIDANNHVEFINAVVSQPSEIIVVVTKTDETCFDAADGTISLAVSGGTLPYQEPAITWNDFATGATRTGLAANTYIATITDANMCTKTVTVVINHAPLFTVDPVVTQISCHGANDGRIMLNFTGGVAPIDFEWTDSPTAGTTRTGLRAGTYTIIIRDGQPCEIRRSFTIVEPAEIIIGANVTQPVECNNAFSGAIDLIPAGGTPPYTIQWTGTVNSTDEDLTNITSGTYLATVTDSHGCTAIRQFTLGRPNPLTITVSSKVSPNCDAGTVAQINTALATGGVPPYSYTWSAGTTSGANNQNMTTNENGTVIVTVTDSKGCTANTTFIVETEQLGKPSFTIDSYASGTYNLYSIMDPVQFTNTSTGDFMAVSWDFGDGSVSDEENPLHTYMREGTYVIIQTVTYPYGCVVTVRMKIVIEKGYDVMIPNAFTPNGDGVNDTFGLQFRGAKSVELNVYDTWGSMIYYEKGETIKGWDGNLKGKPAENGNYIYKISVVTFYGVAVNFEGPFTLIK